MPRIDLPAKLSGAAFVHDVLPRDVLHARTLRQPNRGATLAALDEAAIRRAAKGELQIVREANFVAFVSPVESVAQAAAAAAPAHAKWDNARRLEPAQQEAAWLKGQPSDDRRIGAWPAPATPPKRPVQITVSRPYIAHASMSPSCALAEFRDGHLTVRSHGQGMHPLRKNLAAVLGLPVEAITAQHLHGAGCYGHNGADDAALDAALVAMRIPGRWIRLQWRREEEFGFEPVGPAMLVTLHVDLDERGRPADWTTEIWSPHPRPAAGQRQRLSAGVGGAGQSAARGRADRSAGRARRRRHAQRRAALRRAGASHPASSRAAAAGAHLGAARAGRAAQRLRHRDC